MFTYTGTHVQIGFTTSQDEGRGESANKVNSVCGWQYYFPANVITEMTISSRN